MRNRRPLIATLGIVMLAGVIAGCGTSAPQAAPTAAPEQSAVTTAPSPAVTSTPTAAAPASPTPATAATAGAGTAATAAATAASSAPALGAAASPVPPETIDAMISDLSQQFGVDPTRVSLVSADAVTWRDGSLGCPQPGMMYPQVLTEGFRVVLAADGKEYAYHGSDRGTFFYCANPSQ